ncbi:hypothetical protein BRM3_08200 [Brachybacterium huguangmaarense]|uniref:Phage gp6-like head-tail connector protein n=1 Tax=Brachybacterium huguangmaarense TaxID=1652028 RepID=A0ABY6FXR3_9MICO|nr:hypothetical protein [Brachybacterium huguangmaarense]UYG15630.1 hypothetical protein BRM3_08200 [Brachybacterium huguangmaarense]
MIEGKDVAEFLGQGDNEELAALAGEHLAIIIAMARSYTRGGGFTANEPNEEITAVVTTATARLIANPEQLRYSAGAVTVQDSFRGWTLAETFVLNRYRRRAQ